MCRGWAPVTSTGPLTVLDQQFGLDIFDFYGRGTRLSELTVPIRVVRRTPLLANVALVVVLSHQLLQELDTI